MCYTPTTLKSMARVNWDKVHNFYTICLIVLLTSLPGCTQTSCIWCASSQHQHRIPQTPLTVGSDTVVPVHVAWDLRIYLDSDLLMQTHVVKTASSCFVVLRQIRSIVKHWSHHSSSPNSIMDAPHWQDFRPTYLTGCSRY